MMTTFTPSPYTILLDRARHLLDRTVGEYLSPETTELLTGLPQQTLVREAERGHILTDQACSRVQQRYLANSVLAYMSERHIAATALDAVHYAAQNVGTRLDESAFQVDEAIERQSMPGVCWRLEARTRVSDPTDLALSTWHRGEKTRAVTLLAEESDGLKHRRTAYRAQDIEVRTLWAAHTPLDHHQSFLLHAFRIQDRAGFQVRVLHPTHHATVARTHPVPSVVAYPDRMVYLRHYTEHGRPDGATRIDAPQLATTVGDLLTHLSHHGYDIDAFARLHL